jgi:DNA-binding response OmpR family regulator
VKILIIEDDKPIVETIILIGQVRWPDMQVVYSSKGEMGIEMAETETPDVIILDLGLPDMNGFDVLKGIRAFSDVPIIILSVKGEESNKVIGLDLGADDYVVKPFGPLELLARINSVVRRQQHYLEQGPITCGPLYFEPSMSKCIYQEKSISLTRTEGLVLYELMKNPGKIVSNNDLAELIWGNDAYHCEGNIRAYIRRLRKKLEAESLPNFIKTKVGIGYYLLLPGQ